MVGELCTRKRLETLPIAVFWDHHRFLVSHFQEEQIGELLYIVAIVDAIMAKRMAKPPEFLNNVAHAAIAPLICLMRTGRWPWKTLEALPQPPKSANTGWLSKSSWSSDRFS